jgi:hypothetical protein
VEPCCVFGHGRIWAEAELDRGAISFLTIILEDALPLSRLLRQGGILISIGEAGPLSLLIFLDAILSRTKLVFHTPTVTADLAIHSQVIRSLPQHKEHSAAACQAKTRHAST